MLNFSRALQLHCVIVIAILSVSPSEDELRLDFLFWRVHYQINSKLGGEHFIWSDLWIIFSGYNTRLTASWRGEHFIWSDFRIMLGR